MLKPTRSGHVRAGRVEEFPVVLEVGSSPVVKDQSSVRSGIGVDFIL